MQNAVLSLDIVIQRFENNVWKYSKPAQEYPISTLSFTRVAFSFCTVIDGDVNCRQIILISFRNPGLLATSGTAMVRATARCHLHLHPFPDPHPEPHPYPFLSIIILILIHILIQSIIIHTIILAQALEGGVIREEALEAASNQGQAAVDAQFLGISQVGLFALAASP